MTFFIHHPRPSSCLSSGGGPRQQGAGDGRVGLVDGEGALAAEARHKKRGGGVTGYPTGKNRSHGRGAGRKTAQHEHEYSEGVSSGTSC